MGARKPRDLRSAVWISPLGGAWKSRKKLSASPRLRVSQNQTSAQPSDFRPLTSALGRLP